MTSGIERVFLTGAAGFLGAYVARSLCRRGFQVAILTRRNHLPDRLAAHAESIRVIQGDLASRDWHQSGAEFAPQAVMHLAWQGVAGHARNDVGQAANIVNTLELAAWAQACGVKHFIGAGSQAEYGALNRRCSERDAAVPTTLYGQIKKSTCEALNLYCHMHAIRFVWLRIFSTYGPEDHEGWMIPSLINGLLAGQSPPLTRGEQLWDFLYAQDAADAFIRVLEETLAFGVYNLGSGQARKLSDTIAVIRDMINPALPLAFGEIAYRKDQVMHLEADISRLQQATGWSPQMDLADGLRETVSWYAKRDK